MSGDYQPAYRPLRVLVRNEFDTRWLEFDTFDNVHDLARVLRAAQLGRARKRIVELTTTTRPQPGVPRFRMTTIWEGTRLPYWLGQSYPVVNPGHPDRYDEEQ
ncbi:hypothetical protein AB0C65_38630 [Nocardia sp. NPDC048505]|uniref:hypothetical protein n=1 Tax=Nocardia sp. NPDC048505 TaxID=3155756 RepID=UPI0033E22763